MDNNKMDGAQKSNTSTMWGVVIGIVIVIIVIALMTKNKGTEVATAPTDQTTSTTTTDETPSEDVTTGSVHATGNASITYTEALAQYTDHRIQFDPTCQAIPNTITFKNNTDLMLDNRSAIARTFHLGFMGDISIKPWGFKIVNFSSATLPRAVVIDCGTQQNVAQVQMQK